MYEFKLNKNYIFELNASDKRMFKSEENIPAENEMFKDEKFSKKESQDIYKFDMDNEKKESQ